MVWLLGLIVGATADGMHWVTHNSSFWLMGMYTGIFMVLIFNACGKEDE